MEISAIDKNFAVPASIERPGMVFYKISDAPFVINGIYFDDGKYRRMPESVAKSVSEGVHALHANTAGGRVRFKTNSPYVAIHAVMPQVSKMPHFALTGSGGFDLYVDNRYTRTFVPPYDIKDGYDGIAEIGNTDMHEMVINFPLYSDVSELYIGLDEKAVLEAPHNYTIDRPIVYYGSSITQGGCASRAGTSYQAFVSRALDADHVNLGFSGNAKAEDEMAEYIAGLDMSVFVYDYDHNATSAEYLQNTHERMFLKIREKQPDLPVVFMSRPVATLQDYELARLKIIRRTYNNARRRGDKNVYFIDGRKLMSLCGDEGTVDSCHPTDLGFYSMSIAVTRTLKKIFGIK